MIPPKLQLDFGEGLTYLILSRPIWSKLYMHGCILIWANTPQLYGDVQIQSILFRHPDTGIALDS